MVFLMVLFKFHQNKTLAIKRLDRFLDARPGTKQPENQPQNRVFSQRLQRFLDHQRSRNLLKWRHNQSIQRPISSLTSSAVSQRHWPSGRSSDKVIVPIWLRCKASTRLLTAATMRLTWWYLPSVKVSCRV